MFRTVREAMFAVPLIFRTVLEAVCCSASDVQDSAEGDVLHCL